ncbi:MAG: hypothetical protein NUV42_01875 [Candidatus Yonathbacteria bacterium]|nr:hypothetical protein [Candidatus Yonathbacteria bacterium]
MENQLQNIAVSEKRISSKIIILFWVLSFPAIVPFVILFTNTHGDLFKGVIANMYYVSFLIVVLLGASIIDNKKGGVTRETMITSLWGFALVMSFFGYAGNNFNTTDWLNTGLRALSFWPYFIISTLLIFFCLYVASFVSIKIIERFTASNDSIIGNK